MASHKSIFIPTNKQKYTGKYPIISRSSWEQEFMKYCDLHPDIVEWASEPVKIPYPDPLSGNQKIYVPDFLVTFLTKGGETRTKLVEIKPLHEATESHARNSVDVAVRTKNEAKWGAATQWAMRRGIEFIVWTEANLFNNHKNRKGRAHPIKAVAKEQIKKTASKPRKAVSSKNIARTTAKRRIKSLSAGTTVRAGRVAKARKT